MYCNHVTRSGARCFIMRSNKELYIIIKSELRGEYKNTLKTIYVINIVLRYYFNTQNSRAAKKKKTRKTVTNSPSLPYKCQEQRPESAPSKQNLNLIQCQIQKGNL
jgi:hypothetical protein